MNNKTMVLFSLWAIHKEILEFLHLMIVELVGASRQRTSREYAFPLPGIRLRTCPQNRAGLDGVWTGGRDQCLMMSAAHGLSVFRPT
jgi:hypothetical protein